MIKVYRKLYLYASPLDNDLCKNHLFLPTDSYYHALSFSFADKL